MSSVFYDVLDDDFGDLGVNEIHANVSYVSEDGISQSMAVDAVRSARGEIASAIETWMRDLEKESKAGRERGADIFNRSRFVASNNIFEQFAHCAAAVEWDDILSTLVDTVEGLAFSKMGFELHDEDQEDYWNQVAAGIDLDARLKEMFRELFKVSQFYCAVWWGRQTFKMRTDPLANLDIDALVSGEEPKRLPGNRNRKKEISAVVPAGLSLLDPTKVVPVGTLMFGLERFAYIADRGEDRSFQAAMAGDIPDPFVNQLIDRKYAPSVAERQVFGDMGIPTDRLWLMRQGAVFRHTLTKAQYERFATPRLKSVLDIIDLKRHLREADRAALVGATNFIVVITKGTDKHPARQAEVNHLREQARTVARMPILVGDHRLNVEIVTPALDHTLDEARYNVLDARLAFRALQSLSPELRSGTGASSSRSSSELSRVVSLGIESRRHQMARTLEAKLFRPAVEMNASLSEMPKLKFHPKRVSLNIDQVLSKTVLELLDRGDLSRQTALDEFDFDQDVEAARRVKEAQKHDKIFQSSVPHSSPDANPRAAGRKGGRPPGVEEEEPREEDDD